MQKFEDILVWQKSRIFVSRVYDIFGKSKDYGFRDQIQRASVSVMNNIAEGFERRGRREFSQFLYVAKASCSEVRSMLYVAYDLKYVSKETFEELKDQSEEISRMLAGFIKKL